MFVICNLQDRGLAEKWWDYRDVQLFEIPCKQQGRILLFKVATRQRVLLNSSRVADFGRPCRKSCELPRKLPVSLAFEACEIKPSPKGLFINH